MKKNEIEVTNLYAIDMMLYTIDKLEELGLDGKEEYTYIDTKIIPLGIDIYIITDNEMDNCEIIKILEKGVYESISYFSIDELEHIWN